MVKCLSTVRETRVQSLGWEDPLEKETAIHSSILPGKSHGQRSLEGYSPWNSPGKNTGVSCHSLLQDLPNPRIEPGSLALKADSLPSEPPGKPFYSVATFASKVHPSQKLPPGFPAPAKSPGMFCDPHHPKNIALTD